MERTTVNQQSKEVLGETIARSMELAHDSRKTGLTFLKTEIATGLTFARAAMDSEESSDKRSRNQANARKAFDTITEWFARHGNSKSFRIDMKELEPGFTELKKALAGLGEAV